MYTQCPACHTVFVVEPAQLATAQGKVRCGLCAHVYNAADRLASRLPDGMRALRQTAPAMKMRRSPPAPPSIRRPLEDAQIATAGAVYFPASDRRNKPAAAHPLATFLWVTAIVAALGVLVVQYAYFMRSDLARHSELRPWLNGLCRIMDCQIPPRRDVTKIAVLKRQVVEDPNERGALLVSAVIENQASFPQPYPILQLSLSNINGQLLARGRFAPRQYLVNKNLPAQLPPHSPVQVELKIVDPGKNAINFEFAFL